MTRLRLTPLTAAGIPAALLLLLIAAWAIDTSTGHAQVRRNVSVAGHNIGGLSKEDLGPVLDQIGDEVRHTPVEIVTPKGTLTSNAEELGLEMDKAATAGAALDVGRDGAVPLRPFSWLSSFFTRRKTELRLTVDNAKVAETVNRIGREVRIEPVEPSIVFRDGKLTVVPGKDGEGLDPVDLAHRLGQVQRVNDQAISVPVATVAIPPRFSQADAGALLAAAEAATGEPLVASAADVERPLQGDDLRPLLGSAPKGDRLGMTIDATKGLALLQQVFADVGTPPADATISVSGGKVQVANGVAGTACCDPSAVDAVADALDAGRHTVTLGMTAKPPAVDAATFDKLGIRELVSEFTTNHPCCAPRVTNIHRMADLVRGAVIQPGATFSLNDYVGRRTLARGFVAAPTINGDGNFEDDVGGGVSQFSTTLFNASFFAGLEIDEYMAHGLYISRYPYGREATLSFPSPDLKIRNNTPYGILIWPSYSDTSITVGLYSTPYIEAAQSAQTEEPYDVACVRVTTTRTRTWIATGERSTDRFYALYAPAEGVQCDGSKRAKPGEETTTTTATTAPGAPPTTTSTTATTAPSTPSTGTTAPTSTAAPTTAAGSSVATKPG